MKNLSVRLKSLTLFIGDIAVFYLSLWLTLLIRYQALPSNERWQLHFAPFTLVFISWLLVFYIIGLYNIYQARDNHEFYSDLGRALAVNAVIALAFFYLTPGIDISPKTNFFIYIVLVALFLFAWRSLFNNSIKSSRFLANILIIGLNERSLELAELITKQPQLGFRLVGVIDEEQRGLHSRLTDLPIIQKSYNLQQLVTEKSIRTIVTALDPHHHPQLVERLYKLMPLKITFWDLPAFYEKFTGKVPVASLAQVWFLENLAESEKRIYELIKRIVDILLSLSLIIITLPFWPLIALGIKLNSPGPVFFKQIRVGKGGHHFLAVKFRSMVKDAEIHGPQMRVPGDKRVTSFGRFLRKTRLDELPQLFNVLRGEMSFIGPRPERPEFVKNLQTEIPFYNERHLIKPGLTGWAQVNLSTGAEMDNPLAKLQYDIYYLKNRSLVLDLNILLKTIKIILSGQGF